MRTLLGFCLALLAATSLPAQNQSGFVQPLPGIMSTGSVVHPGGTSSMPGVQRTTGSVVHPGGSTSQIGIPGVRPLGLNGVRTPFRNGTGAYAYPYAYPVYVGGYGYDMPVQQQAPQPGQPNVIVIYPPAPPPAPLPTQMYYTQPPQPSVIEVPQAQDQQQEATHYLIAFKDHSIYSAVAYWVDGDTLHYFTNGNTHNQVSVSLVDRELTKKLNENSGLEVKLPPLK
jgi:hypothetical protein